MWQAWMFPREIQGDMYDDRHRKGVREEGRGEGRKDEEEKERKREREKNR